MKFAYKILLIVFIPIVSAYAWKGEKFEKILADYNIEFEHSKNFQPVKVKENPNLHYDYAIRHKTKKLEIRYFIGLPAPKVEGVDFEAIELYKKQALTTAANVCQCMDKIQSKELTEEFVKIQNADWGANFFVDATSDFGKGFKYSIITAIHKKKSPDLYTIYLYDDYESVREAIGDSLFNLRYAPPK
ncbi:hypothetical protein CH371_00185 [Leptospira wolffii]|uniref:Uncharacterized protein n=1 Tax=Leptospira wolffii TaxID=409998 RepID=A0A2M9ZDY2_9LEPT|nr:hypothetical protein [Leptospira wolffii]PJZ66572.1 hypothetical protein CH371_00185 [Leptospira wolffii]